MIMRPRILFLLPLILIALGQVPSRAPAGRRPRTSRSSSRSSRRTRFAKRTSSPSRSSPDPAAAEPVDLGRLRPRRAQGGTDQRRRSPLREGALALSRQSRSASRTRADQPHPERFGQGRSPTSAGPFLRPLFMTRPCASSGERPGTAATWTISPKSGTWPSSASAVNPSLSLPCFQMASAKSGILPGSAFSRCRAASTGSTFPCSVDLERSPRIRMISLRINGKGEYPFDIDSASADFLTVSPLLAEELGLSLTGSSTASGVGTATAAVRFSRSGRGRARPGDVPERPGHGLGHSDLSGA